MSDELVFMMGQFAAHFPADRKYAKNHMWARNDARGYRFGFSAYAVRLLQDVYFLDWSVDAGAQLRERQPIGSIESSKAESDLFAPMGGRLVEFNPALLNDPTPINVEPYGAGWLLAIEGDGGSLLSPEEYMLHLESSWAVAQRTIKGQLTEP
jgi:glycine cleavage system H protein